MEERELKELVSLFEQSSLQVMEIEKKEDGVRIRMEKGTAAAVSQPAETVMASGAAVCDTVMKTEAEAVPEKADPCETVTAPLVGTFYEAPAPGEAPFTAVGQKVEKGQTLCLIEAMKMMNELKSPVNGTVKHIGSENGNLVEFGQVLFQIQPDGGNPC